MGAWASGWVTESVSLYAAIFAWHHSCLSASASISFKYFSSKPPKSTGNFACVPYIRWKGITGSILDMYNRWYLFLPIMLLLSWQVPKMSKGVPLCLLWCMRAASKWSPWVSGLVLRFVQTWPDSELLLHRECSDLNLRCNHYHLFWHCNTLLVLMCRSTVIPPPPPPPAIMPFSLAIFHWMIRSGMIILSTQPQDDLRLKLFALIIESAWWQINCFNRISVVV